MQPVEAAGALRARRDQAGLPQQPQVTGDRGAADGQRVGELLHGAIPVAVQHLDDGPAVGVAQSVERIAGEVAHS